MLRDGLRNLALLSGFAWFDGTRWLLRQREPLAMALPIRMGAGVRMPEHREAIDVAGSLVMVDGGLVLEAAWLDRASVASFPRNLKWNVRGVRPGEPLFQDWYVLKYWRDVDDGEVNVSDEVLATLRPRPDTPAFVRNALARDPSMAAWCDGTQRAERLTNFVLATGFVGKVAQYADAYVKPFYNVPLQVAAPPALPVPMRLTQDVIAMPGVRRLLKSYSPIPTTFIGEFMAKVRPDDDGNVRDVTHYLRIGNVIETAPDDFSGLPSWLTAWRDSRPRASAVMAAASA